MSLPDTLDEMLQLRPRRALPFETSEEGRITVLRPKILSGRWTWLLRFLARPDYRVKLDVRGSFVWGLCDGGRTIAEIAEAARTRFDDPPEDAARRAAGFLYELARGGFVNLEPGPALTPSAGDPD